MYTLEIQLTRTINNISLENLLLITIPVEFNLRVYNVHKFI